jgi:hypothetical protein
MVMVVSQIIWLQMVYWAKNDELERIYKEAVMIMFWHLPRGINETTKNRSQDYNKT